MKKNILDSEKAVEKAKKVAEREAKKAATAAARARGRGRGSRGGRRGRGTRGRGRGALDAGTIVDNSDLATESFGSGSSGSSSNSESESEAEIPIPRSRRQRPVRVIQGHRAHSAAAEEERIEMGQPSEQVQPRPRPRPCPRPRMPNRPSESQGIGKDVEVPASSAVGGDESVMVQGESGQRNTVGQDLGNNLVSVVVDDGFEGQEGGIEVTARVRSEDIDAQVAPPRRRNLRRGNQSDATKT